jgi:hypothetical protein
MTWTFGNDLTNSDRDIVRSLIFDTDSSNQLITDEFIAWALSTTGNDVYLAAARCCDSLATRFSTLIATAVGEADRDIAKRPELFRAMAATYRAESRRNTPALIGYATDFGENPCFKRGTCYGTIRR